MRQETFRARCQARWQETETLVEELDRGRREAAGRFPELYRQLCHDLAIARDRSFDAPLVERLNQLALRGHQHLYRGKRFSLLQASTFFRQALPRALRAEGAAVALAMVLLLGTMLLTALLIQSHPTLVYSVMSGQQVRQLEAMYDPGSEHFLKPMAEGSRFAMFGFYILNNLSIAFRVFAGGMLFGIGSIFLLLYNGVHLGAAAGHLVRIGYGGTFFGFVASHSALELTAIVLSGVCGLRLGWSLIAPGRLRRGESLRRTARRVLPLLYGAAVMLSLAALTEAFWSPLPLPAAAKYAFSLSWWAGLSCYFLLSGR